MSDPNNDTPNAEKDVLASILPPLLHDINNYTSGVVGAASLIKHAIELGVTPGEITTYVEIMSTAATMLQTLSTRVYTDYISSGRIEVVKEGEIVFSRLIKSAKALLQTHLDVKNIRLRPTFLPDLPAHIAGDEVSLNRIVVNLLSNAIKYSAYGSTIDVKIGALEDIYFIEIIDYGIGIAEADQFKIFEPFIKISDLQPGKGIGLSIVKDLVTQMDGDVSVHSTIGKGSTFRVTLPLLNNI